MHTERPRVGKEHTLAIFKLGLKFTSIQKSHMTQRDVRKKHDGYTMQSPKNPCLEAKRQFPKKGRSLAIVSNESQTGLFQFEVCDSLSWSCHLIVVEGFECLKDPMSVNAKTF